MEKMTCPICGEKFNELEAQILDNGNLACPNCVKEDDKNREKKERK